MLLSGITVDSQITEASLNDMWPFNTFSGDTKRVLINSVVDLLAEQAEHSFIEGYNKGYVDGGIKTVNKENVNGLPR